MFAFMTITAIASVLACIFAAAAFMKGSGIARLAGAVPAKLGEFESRLGELTPAVREEGGMVRKEVRDTLASHQQGLEGRLSTFGQAQIDQLAGMRKEASDGRAKLEDSLKANSDAFSHTQTTRLAETNLAMKDLAERLEKAQSLGSQQQKQALDEMVSKIQLLTEANQQKQDAMREALTGGLDQLRKDNESKLEQMRVTVDEKLQGTLEARLGESFKLVSERLELVHKGLGEMQALATGVGDLKRVLTNVKSRGGWGEVQLGMLLEDMLTADQFARNVRIQPDSSEIVEFAVRLPGKGDERPVYLPIDSKFPHENYDRLLAAQEAGVPADVERAGAALERAVRGQVKVIADKYVHPPYSTDFAIMYLPTEGLFAEVIRRPGLVTDLQSKHRVVVTGPTTLSALLNSLQMGFRTLAIEKRSSEVWQVLSAAKAEFMRYGGVWDKLGKQLETVQKTVTEAGRRTRAVERRLREVETIDLPTGGDPLIALPPLAADADGAEIDDGATAEVIDELA